jgi:peptide/nickel transport system substrate-binding protein
VVAPLLIALALVSCGEARSSFPEANTITVLYPGDISMLGPASDDVPKFLISLPLVNYEPGSYCGQPTPALAESWESSADFREWTIELRPDVLWHDGVPVTAADIVFSLDIYGHPDVLSYLAGPVDSAVALGPGTVRLFLSEPSNWPLGGWVTFLPRHLLEHLDPADFYEWEFWRAPVGNGPFRFVRYLPRTMIELEANPDYYRGPPEIEHVVIKVTAAGNATGVIELTSGGVDLISARPSELAAVADDQRFQVVPRVSSSHSRWLLYHPDSEILGDTRVRRAITQAIDRRTLQEALLLPDGSPLTDAPYSVCQFHSRTTVEPWPYDPGEAGRLLESAGWVDADGDGVRDREERPLQFTLTTTRTDVPAAVLIQDNLRDVGIHMEILELERPTAQGRLESGDFEAGIFPSVLPSMLISPTSPTPSSDVFRTAYPEISALLKRVGSGGEPDPAEQERVYADLALAFREELPATFLSALAYPIVVDRRVRGFGRDGWVPPAWRWPFGGLEFLTLESVDRP